VLSVVIASLNDAAVLNRTLASVLPGMVDGLVRQVIVADGGSTDQTAAIAEAAGVEFVRSLAGMGCQMQVGASETRQPWILFLHAGAVLEGGWHGDAARFIATVERGKPQRTAAAFQFGVDDVGVAPRVWEFLISLWCKALRLPMGEQGLLLPRALYDRLGGHRPSQTTENFALLRQLRRNERCILSSRAVIGAERFRREQYVTRLAQGLGGLVFDLVRIPAKILERRLGSRAT
jgi:glycosyltransferase involved in cell wall biosynthesis